MLGVRGQAQTAKLCVVQPLIVTHVHAEAAAGLPIRRVCTHLMHAHLMAQHAHHAGSGAPVRCAALPARAAGAGVQSCPSLWAPPL